MWQSTMMTDFGEIISIPEFLYHRICEAIQEGDHGTINQILYRFEDKLRVLILTCLKSMGNLLCRANDGPTLVLLLNSLPQHDRLAAQLQPMAIYKNKEATLFPNKFLSLSLKEKRLDRNRLLISKFDVLQLIINTLDPQNRIKLLFHTQQYGGYYHDYQNLFQYLIISTLDFRQPMPHLTKRQKLTIIPPSNAKTQDQLDELFSHLMTLISSIDPDSLVSLCEHEPPLFQTIFKFKSRKHNSKQIKELFETIMQSLPCTDKLRLLEHTGREEQNPFRCLLSLLNDIRGQG